MIPAVIAAWDGFARAWQVRTVDPDGRPNTDWILVDARPPPDRQRTTIMSGKAPRGGDRDG